MCVAKYSAPPASTLAPVTGSLIRPGVVGLEMAVEVVEREQPDFRLEGPGDELVDRRRRRCRRHGSSPTSAASSSSFFTRFSFALRWASVWLPSFYRAGTRM